MASSAGAASPAPVPIAPKTGETTEELLAAVPDEAREALPLLQRLCRVAVGRYPPEWGPEVTGVQLGCACCPPFEDCPPAADGVVDVLPAQEILGLRHHHRGSFTEAGRKQIAATFWGCESGAENRGGTVVVEETNGDTLAPVAYRSGVNPGGCQVLRVKGAHDSLVCHNTDGQGASGYTRIVRYDLSLDLEQPGSWTEIDELPLDGVCLLDVGFPYAYTELQELLLRDIDGDGHDDVVLEVKHRGGVIQRADLDACREESLVPPTLPTPSPARFEYRFDGKRFTPSASTKRLQAKLYGARTAFWARLNGP